MEKFTLYRVTYKGPTNSHGSRFTVTNLTTGTRWVEPYDYASRDAASAAVDKALARESVTGQRTGCLHLGVPVLVGEDSRGRYFLVKE